MTLDTRLARTFELGTWLACAVIAVGLALGVFRIVEAGVICLLALPTLGLAIAAISFARAKERRVALLALVVIGVLGIGLWLG